MSEIVPFRSAQELNVDHVIDEMWSLVEREDVLTGINACLHTLAALIAAHGAMHPDAAGLAERCAELLPSMVSGLAGDMAQNDGVVA